MVHEHREQGRDGTFGDQVVKDRRRAVDGYVRPSVEEKKEPVGSATALVSGRRVHPHAALVPQHDALEPVLFDVSDRNAGPRLEIVVAERLGQDDL